MRIQTILFGLGLFDWGYVHWLRTNEEGNHCWINKVAKIYYYVFAYEFKETKITKKNNNQSGDHQYCAIYIIMGMKWFSDVYARLSVNVCVCDQIYTMFSFFLLSHIFTNTHQDWKMQINLKCAKFQYESLSWNWTQMRYQPKRCQSILLFILTSHTHTHVFGHTVRTQQPVILFFFRLFFLLSGFYSACVKCCCFFLLLSIR